MNATHTVTNQVPPLAGHDPVAGDTALVAIAARLKTVLRRQDLVARLGGDEFAIIIDPAGSRAEIDSFCARLHSVIGEPLPLESDVYRVGASIGVAFYAGESADADYLLSQADAAMYAQKRQRG